MNINQIITAGYPEATPVVADYILWERTPFPGGNVSAKRLYKAAFRLRRAENNGVQLCDLCDNKVESGHTCDSCQKEINKISKMLDKNQGE